MKIIDWQILGAAPPCLDFVIITLFCASPDLIKSNMDVLYQAYHNTFKTSCKTLQVDVPFSLEDLIHDIQTKGLPSMFAWSMFFYDPIGREPNMFQRLLWVWEMTIQYNQNLFDN